MKRVLTDGEVNFLAEVLRLARDEYRNCEKVSAAASIPSLAEQFRRQQHEAETLREIFAEFPTVSIDVFESATA
jgi:hypothetical protein